MNYYRKSVEVNPQLEALRTKALLENSLASNDWISQLIRRTSCIHAGFLFQDLKTLQNLCLYITECQNKITDAGWLSFGYHLGLNPTLLKVIKHNNFNNEDPCYNILLAYVQYENASIGKIIEALNLMGRIDVLSRIKNSINDLADVILHYNSNVSNNSAEDTSDYGSLSTSEGDQSCDTSFSSSLTEVFLRPKLIPPAPFIYQNLKIKPEVTNRRIQEALRNASEPFTSGSGDTFDKNQNCNERMTCNNEFIKNQESTDLMNVNIIPVNSGIKSEHAKENLNFQKKKRYGLKVFLTFAEDGEKYVDEIAKKFRAKYSDYPAIGVLILGEHAERVSMDPQQFIEGAFHQVDYVCPVITPGYYKLITKQEKPSLISYNHIDAIHVPYIYRLMNSYFVANDCCNDKIRCIIPPEAFQLIPFSFLSTNPLFGAWVNLSEVQELAVRLLKSAEKEYYK